MPLLHHTLLTLRLNFRSRQALIYGYLVPLFFLFAFATLYRGDVPRLSRQMGQLLTIGTLGGACFGMPTAMVADRERGVWRRYQLLPAAAAGLVVSTMVARFVLVATAALLQIAVAWLVYRTPMPTHPWHLVAAFAAVAFAFEGLGLVIAALADTVPAVQALGQAVFLPMIMVGGVGVPLEVLPPWARTLAGFLPGRYAVELTQPCFTPTAGGSVAFATVALLVIGTVGCVAGGRMFRWDAQQRVGPRQRAWAVAALVPWLVVGAVAAAAGRPPQVPRPPTTTTTTGPTEPWDAVTDAQIDAVPMTGLTLDTDNVTPVRPSTDDFAADDTDNRDRMKKFVADLAAWPRARGVDPGARVRLLLSVAAVADYAQDPLEGEIARAVFDQLRDGVDDRTLARVLTWVVLTPDGGTVATAAPELGVPGPVNEEVVRQRSSMYARKLLGRLTGKLPDVQP